jgi:AcrR family transcriptional regulator
MKPMSETGASRGHLSRNLIVETAISIADQGGLETVSMRSIANALGVTAMSLYKHVANKDELIDEMLDRVIAEIDRPEGVDWKTAIRTSSFSTRDVLLRHSWASRLWLTRVGGTGQARLRQADWMLRTLRRGDLPEELVYHAYHILESYILGSTLQQLSFPYRGDELTGIVEDFLSDFPVDEFPHMAEHVRQHLKPHEGGMTGFEFALNLLVDGLDRARDSD